MLNLSHKNLDVWRTDLQLVKEVYELTKNYPHEELYGLISQLRRASVSVPSNLSEGLARSSHAETKRFLDISRASIVEIDTQLEISLILELCNKSDIHIVEELLNKSFAMTTNLIKKYS